MLGNELRSLGSMQLELGEAMFNAKRSYLKDTFHQVLAFCR